MIGHRRPRSLTVDWLGGGISLIPPPLPEEEGRRNIVGDNAGRECHCQRPPECVPWCHVVLLNVHVVLSLTLTDPLDRYMQDWS